MPSHYTTKGDDGTTGYLGEGRLPKFDLRIETLGAIDEASASLGLARASSSTRVIIDLLVTIQRNLYGAMAEVAADLKNQARFRVISQEHVLQLENEIQSLSSQVVSPDEFIVPGDTLPGAALAVARTVTRRAERRLAELAVQGSLEGSSLLAYFNRLSSLLFLLELFELQEHGSTSPTLARGDTD